MLEYYFSKGFAILECNTNGLARLLNEVKQIIHAEDMDNSEKSHDMYQHNSLYIKHT